MHIEETIKTLKQQSSYKTTSKIKAKRFFSTAHTHPFDEVQWKIVDARIEDVNGNAIFEQKDVEVPQSWSQQAINIVSQKYFAGKLGTKARETSVRQMISRVVNTIKKWAHEQAYFESDQDVEIFGDELTYLLVNQYASFNSPVWFNLGVDSVQQQCSACFLLSVDDDMASILDWYKEEGLIFKGGSGAGTNLSTIRGSSEALSGGGVASGPVSFMRGSDASSGAIKSGGRTRRAARLIGLDVDHPDVQEFIWCKAREEKKAAVLQAAGFDVAMNGRDEFSIQYQNANNSVRVTDAFMECVENDKPWYLVARSDGAQLIEVKAKELFREIAQAAWECGDPGLQFDTTVNAWHTCSETDKINISNPCQPGFATVLTPQGVKTFDQIDVGSTIWSGQRWTKVIRKVSTGVKPVHKYITVVGDFVGTENHRVVEFGHKVEVRFAKAIDSCQNPLESQNIQCERGTYSILEVQSMGEFPVYDITVDAPEHTYWTGGLLVSNCGEFVFLDNTACNLASLNLVKFQNDDNTLNAAAFEAATKIFITAQEALVSRADYPTKKIACMSHKYRPLGLGYTNLGAFLMRQGRAYDSSEARTEAALITALMHGAAYEMSTILARSVGAFPAYQDNKLSMLDVVERHIEAANELLNSVCNGTRHYLADTIQRVYASMKRLGDAHGYRNAQVTLLAPTGTISFKMDADTTGIEPEIALVRYKKLAGGGTLKMLNRSIGAALQNLGYNRIDQNEILVYINDHGTAEGSILKPEHLPVFDTSFPSGESARAISWQAHIDMMAAVQPFLSGAISKTVNIPNTSTIDVVEDAYLRAWRKGLKSITVYRDGCKNSQPVTTSGHSNGETPKIDDESSTTAASTSVRDRLCDERAAITHKFDIGGHEGYLTVGMYEDGRPGELFIRMAKEGSTISGLMDSFATSISIALQHGVPLKSFVEKFSHTRFEPAGFTSNPKIRMAKSVMDYIFRWLDLKFPEGKCKVYNAVVEPEKNSSTMEKTPITKNGQNAVVDGQTCQDCGSLMVRRGSCYYCENCGTSSGCS